LRSLGGCIEDIGPQELNPISLDTLARIDPMTLPTVSGVVRLGPPVSYVGKLIGIGLNYRDHAEESGMPIPTEPVVFLKTTSSISGPNDPIVLPKGSLKTDWEVELGVVIGRTASYIETRDALKYLAGYVVVNDVSEREYQMERGGTWDKGNGCDTFGPIAYVSRFMTLHPGDIITTGTPPGVGLGRKPEPMHLKAGDEISLGIDKLGKQRQRVIAWQESNAFPIS
jgi:2,4-diketo-3-deoxy-L-fuconate hydrolase